MESAIPSHLRCPRTRTARSSDDYAPPYPAWVARFQPSTEQLVMGYFGVQCPGGDETRAQASLRTVTQHFGLASGPRHHDLAHYVDENDFPTYVAIAYWDSLAEYCKWAATPAVNSWWEAPERLQEGLGHFREVFCPRTSHFETLFSTPDKFEGAGVMAEGLSDEIREHGYWGGMRDRIPASQTDALNVASSTAIRADHPEPHRRVRVQSHDNVALIRSGQDWGETRGEERSLYLGEIEPVLREGMNFLRDHGAEVGCYFNRYMQHMDGDGTLLDKSFGLSAWRSLESMERWSESHPTHLAIFGTFMRVVQQMNFQLKLRLYHEVSVIKAEEQQFEYINCHKRTGLLKSMR